MKILSKTEINDMIVGATILSTGGGGSPEVGLEALLAQLKAGNEVRIASLDEFGNDEVIASPYYVGSIAPSSTLIQSNKISKQPIKDPIATAFKLLENKLGRSIVATVASEIGGGNTAASLAVAAKLGLPAIDGDLMGRAGPELHQSTVHILSFSMVPSAIVSSNGNRLLVDHYSRIDDYEAIARYSSVIAGGHVGVVDSPLTIAQAKQCVVKGTVSRCIEIGKTRREAIERGTVADTIESILTKLPKGRKIFEGVITKYKWRDEKGFLFAEVIVSGTGAFKGQSLKSSIMNEHIMCWINDKPAVMPPDLIIFLDPKSGLGITNDKLSKSKRVMVLGSSIDKIWRKKKGIELFGPRHFGYKYDYVPLEKLS